MFAGFVVQPGLWFNINMSSYQYRKFYCGDKTIVRSSYLHNGISYTGKMTSLYWFSPLNVIRMYHSISSIISHPARNHPTTQYAVGINRPFQDLVKTRGSSFCVFVSHRKCQDYNCVKGKYQITMYKVKHYLRHVNNVNEKSIIILWAIKVYVKIWIKQRQSCQTYKHTRISNQISKKWTNIQEASG